MYVFEFVPAVAATIFKSLIIDSLSVILLSMNKCTQGTLGTQELFNILTNSL
jgi:hypothetical protein